MKRESLVRKGVARRGSRVSFLFPHIPARGRLFPAFLVFLLYGLLIFPTFLPRAMAVEEMEISVADPDPARGGLSPAIARKARFPDPVLVPGEEFPGLLGKELRGLRLFSWRDGAFDAIRFQIDERTPSGDWVFPLGKKNNASQGNQHLDGRDVLLFMARDAGDLPPAETGLPPGASRAEEIVLEDPLDGARRYVYLAFFPGTPPPLCPLPYYVRYNYETEEVVTDCVFSRFIITPDGLHTSFSDIGGIPKGSGGTGGNRIDRLKFRVELRFFFNLIPLRVNEEAMGQDVVAYIQGPIRVIRRTEQFMKLPFGARGLRTYSDVHHYESVTVVPIEVHVPRAVLSVVSNAHILYGMDFDPVVVGSYYRSSTNPYPAVIDGRMSPNELLLRTEEDRWRIIYGDVGAYMSRSIVPPEVAEVVETHQMYEDDFSVPRPPESSPGSLGFAGTDLEMKKEKARAGRHRFFMDIYFPPFYRIGDEKAYLEIRDRPLKIIVGDREYTNRLNLQGEISKDFTD